MAGHRRLPLSFESPDDNAIKAVRGMLRDLPIRPSPTTSVAERSLESAQCSGDLEMVVDALRCALEKDVSEHAWDGSAVDSTVSYVVDESATVPGALDVLTRYSLQERGGVYYGRTILRLADDKFVMWVDD